MEERLGGKEEEKEERERERERERRDLVDILCCLMQ